MDDNQLKEDALNSFLSQVGTDEEKINLIKEKFEENTSPQEFASSVNYELELGCPPGWTRCDDGSCTPPGTDCT